MAVIERRLYREWDEFAASLRPELFGDGPFAAERYLFRGVADADWRLKSSFDHFRFPEARDPQGLSERLLDDFRFACADLVDAGCWPTPSSCWRSASIMACRPGC